MTGRLSGIRTTVAFVTLLILVLVAACTDATKKPSTSVEDLMQEAGLLDPHRPPQLRIGVYTWQRPMAYVDETSGRNEGFDVEIARYIAGKLGYEGDEKISWVALESVADRMKVLQDNTVDLVVASFSITDEKKRFINLAGPYLITEQSVMVTAADKASIATIDDLKNLDNKICTSTGSTSEALLKDREIPYVPLNSDLMCFDEMRRGHFKAISTDRTILSGFVDQNPTKFAMLDMKLATATNPGTERLGIGVARKNTALRRLIDYFLNLSYLDQQDGRVTDWQRAYAEHLKGLGAATQPEPDDVPDLVDFDSKSPGRPAPS
jgi:glutamate transport system substrate-binding protein